MQKEIYNISVLVWKCYTITEVTAINLKQKNSM